MEVGSEHVVTDELEQSDTGMERLGRDMQAVDTDAERRRVEEGQLAKPCVAEGLPDEGREVGRMTVAVQMTVAFATLSCARWSIVLALSPSLMLPNTPQSRIRSARAAPRYASVIDALPTTARCGQGRLRAQRAGQGRRCVHQALRAER